MKSSCCLSVSLAFAALAVAGVGRAADEPAEAAPEAPAITAPAQPATAPQSAAAPAAATAPQPAGPRVENSIVKVFATMRGPDFGKPWTKQSPRPVTASGVVIEGNRILTNAHAVTWASEVQIQGYQAGDKLSAQVVAIAPGIDLAVLKLDDPEFFATHPPLPRANTLPAVKDPVMAYGFPVGGTEMSITKGIVSRIEFASYGYETSGLRVQIDAAINAGNSGGPVVAGDKMIGLAKSVATNAQNIGYIVPNEEIELFLADIADGHYDGKPALWDDTPTLENTALRASLKILTGQDGVVVHAVENPAPGYPLKKWDVITKIGDTPIDNQGKIKLGENRVGFRYLVQKLTHDGKVPLTVIRNGHELKLDVPVEYSRPKLIPFLNGEYPPYFVYGPLVFSPATEDLIMAMTTPPPNSRVSPANLFHALTLTSSPLMTRRGERPTAVEQELVVVPSPFLPHKLTKGYGSVAARVVQSVDGIAIKNLRHLVEVLRDGKSEYVTIEFAGRGGESLVLPRREVVAATDEILTDNGIRSQASPDLLKVWQARGP